MSQETSPQFMSDEEKQKRYSNPTNEFNLLWYEIQQLKRRLYDLERTPRGFPFLEDYTCKTCGRRYSGGYGAIACGAMPKCPYCGKLQVWWEESKKDK